MRHVNGSSPRVVALVGPFSSGKTTLLSALAKRNKQKNMTRSLSSSERVFYDGRADAKALEMGTMINCDAIDFLDEKYVFLDCPGSVEFQQITRPAFQAADVAIVVVEPDANKVQSLAGVLHELEEANVPHLIFINKVDRVRVHMRDFVQALKAVSKVPLVMRQVPLREKGELIGCVDLATKAAYRYQKGARSKRIEVPPALLDQITDDRFMLLEQLADHHDHLLEELLEDVEPPVEEVFDDLAADIVGNRIVPVLMGSAEHGFGLTRLMKALRHEIPSAGALDRGLCVAQDAPAIYPVQVDHLPHVGKVTLARVISGTIEDGAMLAGERIAGLQAAVPGGRQKTKEAGVGDMVYLSRFEGAHVGVALGASLSPMARLAPVYGLRVLLQDQKNEAKLSDGLTKLEQQDPSLVSVHDTDTQELVLWGQGEMHLRAAAIRMEAIFGVGIKLEGRHIPYKETIKNSTTQHSRFKKQTGGHGQFGDVVIEVKPKPQGSGFSFESKITGGAIPRQYIPSVESGVREYLSRGPLGFPVVDVEVTLTDGTYHSVDSSDQAFKSAARMAMAEALPDCEPVLLEPVERVRIMAPNDYTARINSLISSRRGQIVGYDVRPGWPGWDKIETLMPQASIRDLIIELRSLTQGTGTFEHELDHLEEITGSLKDKAIEELRNR